MTRPETVRVVAFYALVAAVIWLFLQMLAPFFSPIAYAAVLAIVFAPLHSRIRARIKSPSLAAFISLTLVVVIIVGPAAYLLIALASEAKVAVATFQEMNQSGQLAAWIAQIGALPLVRSVKEGLFQFTNLEDFTLESFTATNLANAAQVIGAKLGGLVADATRAVFFFFLMLNALFFFFRDGETIVSRLRALTPLPESDSKQAFLQLKNVIEATMYGGVAVAMVQGLAGGILFAAVGLPSPVFWGAVMAFLSFLPLIGSFLVFTPAGLYLIASGATTKGVIVLAVGGLVITQLDNFLRPALVAGRTSLHTLMLFFSILGGIAMFGFLGLVLGPLIAALFVTVSKTLVAERGTDITI